MLEIIFALLVISEGPELNIYYFATAEDCMVIANEQMGAMCMPTVMVEGITLTEINYDCYPREERYYDQRD